MKKYRITYTIKGTYTVSENDFSSNQFEGMSDEEILEYIKEVEEGSNLGDRDVLEEGKLEVEVELA